MSLRTKLQYQKAPAIQAETVTFLVLFLLATFPYLNTLLGNFVYDDGFQVVENPYVHSFRYLPQIFGSTVWSFQGAQGITNYYRPLMTFAYLLCYQIAGAIPFSFHLANIVLHALVVILVFLFLRRLSGERVALIAAGLFALHPIHTESVAWIAAITDLELAVFYLLTFLFYLRLTDSERVTGNRIGMCVSFALACLSKEQAMTLPVAITIFEHFYRADRESTSFREKFSRYAPVWAVAAVYMILRSILLGGVASVVSRPNMGWYEVLLSAISLIGGYLWKLIWPMHFAAFYVFHRTFSIGDSGVLFGILGLAVCAGIFVALWRRARIVSFGMVWIFLTLGPVLNARWMPASVFAERYLYLPSVGFCWMVAWGASTLWSAAKTPATNTSWTRRLSWAVPVILAAMAMFYAVRTVARNREWRSEETLYKQTLDTQEDASLIRSNLGAIYFDRGDAVNAEREWLAALTNGPNNVFLLGNLGMMRGRQHRYDESLDYYGRALRARPVYTLAHLNLATTLGDMGRDVEAEWHLRVATTISPLSTQAHNRYGKFLFDAGRLEDARTEYERSVRVDPTSDAYDHLGDIYVKWQDQPRAEQAFRDALAIDPFDSHAHFGLATAGAGRKAQRCAAGSRTRPGDRPVQCGGQCAGQTTARQRHAEK